MNGRPTRTVQRIVSEVERVPLEEALKLALAERGFKFMGFEPYRSIVATVIVAKRNEAGGWNEWKIKTWTTVDYGYDDRGLEMNHDDFHYNHILDVFDYKGSRGAEWRWHCAKLESGDPKKLFPQDYKESGA